MNYILPSEADLVQYTLRSSLGILKISAPINWDDDEKVFKRNTSVHGVFISLSNNLEFPRGDENNNGGYDYLVQLYKLEGINASCLLVKEEDLNGEWVESYRGYLDFSTFSRQNNIAKIKFNESGLYEKIKARQSESIELNRETTLDGDEIEPLVKDTVLFNGREIQIVSQLEGIEGTSITVGEDLESYEARAIPLRMTAEETGNIQTIYTYDVDENISSYGDGTTGNMFYAIAEVETDLKLEIDVNINVNTNNRVYEARIDIVKYGNDENYDFISYDTLTTFENLTGTVNNVFYKGVYDIKLNVGESLCLAIHTYYKGTYFLSMPSKLIYPIIGNPYNNPLYKKSTLIISEKKYFEKSTADFVFAKEALDRTIHIITGEENTLDSTELDRTSENAEQTGAYTGLTNGFYVRGFNDENLTFSFKDIVESLRATWQLGYGITKKGFKEVVKMAKIDYFYQNLVTIKIDKPNDIKRTVASDYFYSSLTFGYDKPSGDTLYEEAMGLDEYNIEGNYVTPITRVEENFESKSKFRADSYGKEFARRKPKSAYPEEDTRYDKDVMIMDLKPNTENESVFLERVWEDDFEAPLDSSKFTTGVYSYETATNLRLSPLNCMLRWAFWIKGGLDVYKDKYIRYASTEGNSSLRTQLIDSANTYSENLKDEDGKDVGLLISNLEKSIFVPEYIEFEYPVDTELLMQVNSTSINKNGNKIMNYYGMVEFVNEDGLLEYGFLMELKPNGNGSWKLLKANKKSIRRSVLDEPIPKPPKPTQTGFNYELNHEIDG